MTTTRFDNYSTTLNDDATQFIEERMDEIWEKIKDGNTQYDLIDYDWTHEFVDGLYINFTEACAIIDNCENEETDSGLWEGIKDLRDAVIAMGFYSYRNDLHQEAKTVLRDKLEEFQQPEDDKLESLLTERQAIENKMDNTELDDDGDTDESLQEQADELDEQIDEQRELCDNLDNAIDNL